MSPAPTLQRISNPIQARTYNIHIHVYTADLSYKGDTRTHVQGTDSRVALEAYGELHDGI